MTDQRSTRTTGRVGSWRLLAAQPGDRGERDRAGRGRRDRASAANWIAPYGVNDVDVPNALQPPSGAHWFGTDELGRDVLSRVLVAIQASMQVAVVSVAFAVVVGVTVGVLAGYRGGWLDTVVMRVVDVMFAFPVLLLALAIVAVLGPGRHHDDAGDRRRLHADLRAGRPRQHARRPRRTLRAGVAHDGHRPPLHPGAARPAEHRRPADRADVAVAGVRDPVRGGAVVPGPGHPATRSRRWAG